MKRYVVSFVEHRRYESVVFADDPESAIRHSRIQPEFPVWVSADLGDYEAEEITGDAP